MNLTRASNSIVRAVKRRLETSQPASRLVEDSIKRLSLPGTHHQVTLFIAQRADESRIFVAELCEPDLPHIYQAIPLPKPHSFLTGGAKADARDISKIMLTAIRDIAITVANDPRFKPNVIVLNGHELNRSIAHIDQTKNNL